MSCRLNQSWPWSCQTNPSCPPSSKTVAVNRTVSSPRQRPRRCSHPPMATRHRRLTRADSSPHRPPRTTPGLESVLRLCQSSRNRGLPQNCSATRCLTVTLATVPQTPSLMPKTTRRIPACRWSLPMAAQFTTRQLVVTRRSLN